MSERDAWLAAWVTPDELLEDAVRAATGAGIAARERLIVGEANETYRITTTAGDIVVLKVNHVWENSFASMEATSVALLAAGIRVPRVLLRRMITVGDRTRPLVVQTYLPGKPMSRAIGTASDGEATRWTVEAGELLARIHSLPVDAPDVAAGETLGSLTIADAIRRVDNIGVALHAHGIDPDRIRALLDRHRRILDGFAPCIEHGDYGTGHLIIQDGCVAGVIDLDSTSVGTPLTDIGWWDTYCDRAPHPTETLLRGYRCVRDTGDVDGARAVFGLARSFEHLQYYIDVADPSGASYIARVIERRAAQVTALGDR